MGLIHVSPSLYFDKISLPLAVNRYFCLLLVGLSGTVISIQCCSNKGRRTWSLNLVRFERPANSINSINSINDRSFKTSRRIFTWSRLGSQVARMISKKWLLPRNPRLQLSVYPLHIPDKAHGYGGFLNQYAPPPPSDTTC